MVNAGQSIQLQATVTGSTNTAVQWSMSPALGTISSSGMYAAPANIAVAQTITISVASVADPTKFASTNISLVPAIGVSQGFPPIRIHAGPAYTDPSGILWSADSNFTGGAQLVTQNSISNTSTPGLYQSVHYGDSFTYSFAVPNGTYSVNLKFAELFVSGPGTRLFDVLINGTVVLPSFDIFLAAGGANLAVDRTFLVPVTNGRLDISSRIVKYGSLLSAIEITQ
jgi:hypothetical protein